MITLAESVNQVEHVDWCFPSLETLEAYTDISRSTLIECIAQLQKDKWLTVEPRKGYGNAYVFNVTKLEKTQRPEKAYPSGHRTRLYTGPVRSTGLTRPVTGFDPSGSPPANKEEQEVNKKEQEPFAADAASAVSKDSPKPQQAGLPMLAVVKPGTTKPEPVRAPDARHNPFRDAVLAYQVRMGVPAIWSYGGADDGALRTLLKASPNLALATFEEWLQAKGQSNECHGEAPHRWLSKLSSYATGPRDKYGKPVKPGNTWPEGETAQERKNRKWASVGEAVPTTLTTGVISTVNRAEFQRLVATTLGEVRRELEALGWEDPPDVQLLAETLAEWDLAFSSVEYKDYEAFEGAASGMQIRLASRAPQLTQAALHKYGHRVEKRLCSGLGCRVGLQVIAA